MASVATTLVGPCVRLYLIVLFVIPSLIGGVLEKEFILEAENAVVDRGRVAQIMHRSLASGRKSMAVRSGTSFHFDFCLDQTSWVTVGELRYSNDGPGDTIQVHIDQVDAGLIHTTPLYNKSGSGWNYFMSSDGEGEQFSIRGGRHRLTVTVTSSDLHGTEIDFISLIVNGSQNEFTFNCQVYCFSTIEYKEAQHDGAPIGTVAWIQQNSKYTKCAEEDNINIPVYGANVEKYSITATHPKYKSFNNSREADFDNCDMVTALWTFRDIMFASDERPGHHVNLASIGPKFTKHNHGDVAALIAGLSSGNKIVIKIDFVLDGPSKGVVDSEIGSILYLKVRQINEPLFVRLEYRGSGREWTKAASDIISADKLDCRWEVPDFTWTEGGGNQIKLEMVSVGLVYEKYTNVVEIEVIELSRRYKRKTQAFHMYNDGKILVEGADIDFWWLVNTTMTVTVVDTGETFHSADYIRLYHNVPWAKDHFSQIVVLYQDGNVRLLPITPHGLDWVPFGSSVLLGQSDPSVERPSASIRHVDLTIETLTMDIYYHDGGMITAQIVPTNTNTTIVVNNSRLNKTKLHFPFLTIRSMWVADGNADMDHVIVDRNEAEHVMSRWNELQGRYFAFFRRCISKHNTQSPDLVLQTIS